MIRVRPLLAALLLVVAGIARAEVKLPSIFGSHMVLQRDVPIPVWGWDNAGQQVTVQLGDAPAVAVTTGADGRWRVDLPARPAGGPLVLTIRGSSDEQFDDVLIGEVWLCSGQSNMEWTVGGSLNAQAEIQAGDHPRIRHIKVPRVPQPDPVTDFEGDWQVCSPTTVAGFTACGYFMARELERELDVPVGLVNSSWGGTRIEPWTTPAAFAEIPTLQPIHDRVQLATPGTAVYRTRLERYLTDLSTWLDGAREALAAGRRHPASEPFPQELKPLTDGDSPMQQPTTLYCGMIHPLVPYAMRGAIWYQGESNHGEGLLYADKMQALIDGWRAIWGLGPFPFYFVQIAPYNYGTESSTILPEFWLAQSAVVDRVANTGMVVTTDIGNINDIHPTNKQEVGRRLALLALRDTYGRPQVVADGPIFENLAVEGATLRLSFRHADGLRSRDGQPLTWFEVIGPGADWEPAIARIDGTTVVVSSPNVAQPTAVRFAWHKLAEPNLQNGAGLPAPAFRAGDVPVVDYLALKVPEAAGYTLVLDLDLARLGAAIEYNVDARPQFTGRFDRIAYFLELKREGQATQWVYTSMDAFTDDLAKVGIPLVAVGASFQQRVANLNVLSNVEGIATGEGLAGGNLEFWPNNYGPPNSAGIPGADTGLWDYGDQPGDPVDGYGCMQVHNHEAQQTIWAINAWKQGGNADLGIGNSSTDPRTRDWTFAANGGQYQVKRLRVLVRPAR